MKRIFVFLFILFLLNKSIIAQCDPAFTYSINESVVLFESKTTNLDITNIWDFGDGSTGDGNITSHSYNSSGTYNVMHILYDSLGNCRDSLLQSVTLNFSPACQASFYLQNDPMDNNFGIHFFSTSTYSGTGIKTYTWSVNGVVQQGNNSYLKFYPESENITICLYILTDAGCSSSSCQTINLPSSCNYNPSFTYKADLTDPHKISFSPNLNQPNLRYLWEFENGYLINTKQAELIYNRPGIYSVKLTVWDSLNNCIDTVKQEILVYGTPADSCTGSFTYILNNNGFAIFSALSNQTITSQNWFIYNFQTGDTLFINTNSPSYQFIDTGYYQACVTITTNTGCIQTHCENIHVDLLTNGNSGYIPVYPNPATSGDVNLNVKLAVANPIKLRVFDMNGNLVWQSKINGFIGFNSVTIPAGNLKKGQYLLEISYNDTLKRSKFQKL